MKGFFDGQASGKRRVVDLRGRGAAQPVSRDALLEAARREREQRSEAKARGLAALRLQAAWRGGRARQRLRCALRDALRGRFGDGADRLSRCGAEGRRGAEEEGNRGEARKAQHCLLASPSPPRALTRARSRPRSADACGVGGAAPALLFALPRSARGACDADASPLLLRTACRAALAGGALQAAWVASDAALAHRLLLRAQRLGWACLEAACGGGAAAPAAADALDMLLNGWKASPPATAVLRSLASRGAFARLRAALLASAPAAAAAGAAAGDGGDGAAPARAAAAAWRAAARAAEAEGDCALLRAASAQLLSLPGLSGWPALAAALPPLWAASLGALAQEGRLPLLPGGEVGAAWLLGNALEGAEAGLGAAAAGGPHATPATAAAAFASAALLLLPLLPPGALGGGAEPDEAEESEEEDGDGPRAMAAEAAAAAAPPPPLASRLALLLHPPLLRALADAAFPADGAAGAGAGADALCALLGGCLDRMAGLPREKLLAALAFDAQLVPRLWPLLAPAAAAAQSAPGQSSPPPALALLAPILSHALCSADEDDFYLRGAGLGGAAEAAQLACLLRDALWRALETGASCGAMATLQQQLHCRNGRRRFAPAAAFCRPELGDGEGGAATRLLSELAGGGPPARRARRLLRTAPSLLPFHLRARLFAQRCAAARRERHDARAAGLLGMGGGGPIQLTVRRGHAFEDGVAALAGAGGGALAGGVRVQWVSAEGEAEAGVDGGGLFKDFLDAFWTEGFSPANGLWREAEGSTLFPAPFAAGATAEARAAACAGLRLCGALLAKALQEGLLADVPLAEPLLGKLRGEKGELNDLAALDGGLYRSLLALKRFQGDHSALCLSFTAPGDGDAELAPGGAGVAVSERNKLAYIQLAAHHALTASVRPQCAAFVEGFTSVVPAAWLRAFSAAELSVLVSGARGGGLDVADLARHCNYGGGYDAQHPTIAALWELLSELSSEQQRAFLKFVTACPRAPLLGFGALHPRFTVHRAAVAGSEAGDESADLERLPTAATCSSLLKLPPYRSKEELRGKLLYAISSGAGFDLS